MPSNLDDSISPVISAMVGASRLRSPGKFHDNRYGDTQRSGSAPRSSSGPKQRVYAAAVIESNLATRGGRYISKRKERRWDNDHLFGMDIEVPEFGSRLVNDDYHSNFRKLFKDADATELFRSCSDAQFLAPSKSPKVNVVKTEMTKAQDAWYNVENRLRGLVLKILERSAVMKRIMYCMESIVVAFKHEKEVVADTGDKGLWHTVSDSNAELLRSILQSDLYKTALSPSSPVSLAVPLVDNVSYRLLLHTVCQYHGLRSQSITTANGRITVISRCREQERQTNVPAVPVAVAEVRESLEDCHLTDETPLVLVPPVPVPPVATITIAPTPEEVQGAPAPAGVDCLPLVAFLYLSGKLSQGSQNGDQSGPKESIRENVDVPPVSPNAV